MKVVSGGQENSSKDMPEPSFKISSALKSLIGKELVTNKYVAILELVKNSYDAGARNVWVVFDHKNLDGEVSAIRIMDNGSGMSKDDVFDRWLFLAYSSKRGEGGARVKDYRYKETFGRSMAGQKGIGRFSCDTLGGKLSLTTLKENDPEVHRLEVDWGKFEESQDVEFKDILLSYREQQLEPLKFPDGSHSLKGTILSISSVREYWPHEHLERLTRYLQRMVNPYSSESGDSFTISLIATIYEKVDEKLKKAIEQEKLEDEDSVYLGPRPINGKVENTIIEDIKELTTRISSEIDGEHIKTTLIDKGRLVYSVTERNPFPSLNNCRSDIFYLNTRAKQRFTSRMGVRPVDFGSIYVYKNYFRILPYGDEGDDWLGLDRKKGQGYARFLSTREIIGRVSVSDKEGRFKEVSSREGGFLHDEAFESLKSFVLTFCVERLTKYVTGAIKWDGKKSPSPDERKIQSLRIISSLAGRSGEKQPSRIEIGEDILSIVQERMVESVPDLVTRIESLAVEAKDPAAGEAIADLARSLKNSLDVVERDMQAREHERLFMAKAKSTEDFSDSILHEVKESTHSIINALTRVSYAIDELNAPKKVKEDVRYALLRTQRIEYISRVGSLANFNTTKNKITAEVPRFVKDYIEGAANVVSEMNMEPRFLNADLTFVKKFTPLELTIILDNLWTNAYKAAATTVVFRFEDENGALVLLVSDNGTGVSDEAFPNLFSRGYSTRGGSGLGLYNSRYIAETNGWNFDFVGNNVKGLGKGACFKLVM